MTVIAIRIYDTPQNAKGAVTKLKKSHVNDSQIAVVSGEGKAAADVATAIAAVGIPAANAKALAESVAKGGTLVAVCPLFGKAYEAAEILDSFSPTEACELATGMQPEAGSDATSGQALSAAAGWSLLSSNATPLSDKLGLPVLSKK
jgi:thiamine monophosphate kinase